MAVEAGGMSTGNYATSESYSWIRLGQLSETIKQANILDPLRKMRLSAYGMFKEIGKEEGSNHFSSCRIR